jgi:hypothetical protein
MSKYINQSQITGEKGVAAFYSYACNIRLLSFLEKNLKMILELN